VSLQVTAGIEFTAEPARGMGRAVGGYETEADPRNRSAQALPKIEGRVGQCIRPRRRRRQWLTLGGAPAWGHFGANDRL